MTDANAMSYWMPYEMLTDGEGDMVPSGNVLITGGTGTLGTAILERARAEGWDHRVTVYSRSELRQAELRRHYPRARYLLGDVRDADRLELAVSGHSTVLHLAAMKRVPECEEQPGECLQTNVLGTYNVMRACQRAGVGRCVVVSTDKAAAAITTYGASKRFAEGLVSAAPSVPTMFTAVRYGNVLASNGSVIPIWRDQAAQGKPLTITDRRMTRFWMTAADAVDLVLYALTLPAGTIAVPKMAAMGILDMAMAVAPGAETIETGLRSLEKLHEDLVHPDELAIETETHFLLGTGTRGHRYTSDIARQLTADDFLAMIEPDMVSA